MHDICVGANRCKHAIGDCNSIGVRIRSIECREASISQDRIGGHLRTSQFKASDDVAGLSSIKLDAKTFARAVRTHWGIENRLHWILDVVFHDDLARLRTGHGPENMAIVKHIALNLVRQGKPTTSFKNRRKLADWNLEYLDTVIRGSA